MVQTTLTDCHNDCKFTNKQEKVCDFVEHSNPRHENLSIEIREHKYSGNHEIDDTRNYVTNELIARSAWFNHVIKTFPFQGGGVVIVLKCIVQLIFSHYKTCYVESSMPFNYH